MGKKRKLNKKFVFCFDIDNTICKTIGNNYKKSVPIKKNINSINYLHKKGHHIKIFTSRYMGRTKSNSTLAKKLGYKKTLSQLKSWGLNFDELIMGKPRFDFYVDDKNLNFKSNLAEFINNNY
jgi:nicotinamidase-related amidase